MLTRPVNLTENKSKLIYKISINFFLKKNIWYPKLACMYQTKPLLLETSLLYKVKLRNQWSREI